jgi:hypothetical protein
LRNNKQHVPAFSKGVCRTANVDEKIDYFVLVIHQLLQDWSLRHKIFYKKDENRLDCGAGAHKKMTAGIPGESGKPVVICTFGES